jgi:hypothetical protein
MLADSCGLVGLGSVEIPQVPFKGAAVHAENNRWGESTPQKLLMEKVIIGSG